MVLALVLLLAVPMGTVFAQQAPAFEGTAVVSDGNSKGDSITVKLANATAPAAGREYVAWLSDDAQTERVRLGVIDVNAAREGALTFGPGSTGYNNTAPVNLAKYNRMFITSEAAGSKVATPAGAIVYLDVIPIAAAEHIRHLLIAWPAGSSKGILTNLREQLALAKQHAVLSSQATTMANMQTHAKHVVNIIEGTTGPNFAASFGNPGDGQGVLLHASDRKHAGFAATAAPSETVLAQHAALVSTAGKNAADYATLARNEALRAINAKSLDIAGFSLAYVIGVLDNAINGIDSNADGTITAQEGGAVTAYIEAQLMQTFTLQAGTQLPPPGNVGDPAIPVMAQIALALSVLLLAGGAASMVAARRKVRS